MTLSGCTGSLCTPLPTQNSFALVAGGGFDIAVFRHVSNPAIQEQDAQSSSQQQPAQLPGTDGQDPEDTVHLSQGAQIQQMAQQGESAAAIASTTGLTASEVDSDLGISTTSSSVALYLTCRLP